MAIVKSPVATVLNTTVGETGNTQETSQSDINDNIPIRFQASIGSGDTLVLEGVLEDGDSYATITTFDASNLIRDVYLSPVWRARRTVDGGADSTLKILNSQAQSIEEHV